jgi:hypothetical protein
MSPLACGMIALFHLSACPAEWYPLPKSDQLLSQAAGAVQCEYRPGWNAAEAEVWKIFCPRSIGLGTECYTVVPVCPKVTMKRDAE